MREARLPRRTLVAGSSPHNRRGCGGQARTSADFLPKYLFLLWDYAPLLSIPRCTSARFPSSGLKQVSRRVPEVRRATERRRRRRSDRTVAASDASSLCSKPGKKCWDARLTAAARRGRCPRTIVAPACGRGVLFHFSARVLHSSIR